MLAVSPSLAVARDSCGLTTLHIAAAACDAAAATLLLQCGAGVHINARDLRGMTPAMCAAHLASEGAPAESAVEFLEVCISAQADLSLVSNDGRNVLHHAFRSAPVIDAIGSHKGTQQLSTVKDTNGMTAMALTRQEGDPVALQAQRRVASGLTLQRKRARDDP